MIVIVRGEDKKKVPVSTYNNFFKAQGWVIEGEVNSSPEPIPVKEESKPKLKEEPIVEQPKEEIVNEPEVVEEEISDDDWDDVLEELQDDEVEKPISEMNKSELMDKAKKMGIKVPANSSNKQIRDLIKASK